jgi:hypothetical protein
MVSIMSLWLPIILSAVIVFVASAVFHMFLTYHNSDFKKLPDEDRVMAALRPFALPLGQYVMPQCGHNAQRREQAFKDKVKAGPVAFLTVMPSDYGMGKSLALWFAYCLGMGIFTAYIAGHALAPGANYFEVFRLPARPRSAAALGLQELFQYHRP